MKHCSHFYCIFFLLLLGASINTSQVFSQTAPAAQALPYTQDFSALLATSTTYPAGWQGWALATASSAAFRVTTPTGNSVLNASSTAASTAGGIHNYNGKIGMLASGSIDPSICLAINTTNYANVQVTMDLMTIRNPTTRVNGVDLQYIVGTITGTWTTVSGLANGIYQNNATAQTTAVTTPQNTINMSYTLPAACNNQSVVYLRWAQRDISGSGSRSSFAVDNISICSSTTTPTLSIGLTSGTIPACEGTLLTFEASATNEGLTPNYQWKVNGGNVGTNSTTFSSSSLLSGDLVTCELTSSLTCATPSPTISNSITVLRNSLPVANCSIFSNVLCNGGSSGSINVSASGSTPPYSGIGLFSGLSAGVHTYTVSDNNGCSSTCSSTLSEPALLVATCTLVSNESSPGANDGIYNVSASGGTAPYSGDGTFGGQSPGTYGVTMNDVNGCIATCSVTVGTDCTPSLDPTGANSDAISICAGNSVSLSVVGGNLGTSASWKWYEGGCGVGASIGSGASINSSALTTPGVYVFYVRAEGACGTTTCASVSVTVSSASPLGSIAIPPLTAPVVGCVGGTATISCTAVAGATGYSWSGPPGVLFDGNPSPYVSAATTVTLTYVTLPPPGISGWNICVFAKNSCGTSPNTKCHWIRATLSTPSLSGSSIGCAGGNEAYIIGPVDGAASYTWTITGAATLNGSGTSVITAGPSVNAAFGAGFTGGQLCVFATTSCGTNSGVRCMSISNAPPLPGSITGSSTICPGSGSGYSIAPVAGALSYNWTVSGAGISVIGAGTNATISTTAGFTSGSICVVAVSACGSPAGNSSQRCKTISSGKLGTPGNITGDPIAGVCGQTYTYSIPSMAGATGGYAWSIPPGATGSSSSNSITITFPSVFVSGSVCVHGINACGAGSDRCITVFGNPSTPTTLTGNSNPCAGSDEVYSWPAVPGASQYQVIVPIGYTVLSGTPTISNFAVINVTAASGQIGVKAVNSCGVSGTRTLLLSPVGCRFAANQPDVMEMLAIEVFPNPARGSVNLQFNSSLENESYILKVTDMSGRMLNEINGKSVQGTNLHVVDISGYTAGIYLMTLTNSMGSQVIRLVVE